MSTDHNREGFAIVVVLLFIAFLMTLGMALLWQCQVELVAMRNHREHVLAKKYAVFTAQLALGELQNKLGKDTAVSAYGGDLNGNAMHQENWLKAWDTLLEKDKGSWLVSNPNGTMGVHQYEEKTVLGKNTKVPFYQLKEGNSVTEISYWVVDEGMKFPIAYLDDLLSQAPYAERDWLAIQRLRQEAVSTFPAEKLWQSSDQEGLPEPIAFTEKDKMNLSKALSVMGIQPRVPLTVHSKNLLTNSESGGLKQNILSPDISPDEPCGFILNEATQDFLNPNLREGEKPSLQAFASEWASLPAGTPLQGTPLIITEMSFMLKVLPQGVRGWPRNRLRFFLQLRLEIWSPYGTALDLSDLDVVIEDFPSVDLQYYANGIGEDDEYTDRYTLSLSDEDLTFQTSSSLRLEGGELRDNFTPDLANSSRSGRLGIRYPRQRFWTIPSSYNDRRLILSINRGSFSVIIKKAGGGSESPYIGELRNIPINAHRKEISLDEDDHLSPFHIHLKMNSSWLDGDQEKNSSLEHLFGEQDMRQFSDITQMLLAENPCVSVITESIADQEREDSTFLDDRFLSGQNTNFFHRLYDLPQHPPISLGWLSHLPIKDYPSFSIGNSWGGELNDVFDRYFIGRESAIDPNTSTTGTPYLFARSKSQDGWWTDAKNYYWQAINLNQSNPQLWELLLSGGTFTDWKYVEDQHQSEYLERTQVKNSFSRLPHSAEQNNLSFSGRQAWPFLLAEDYPELTDQEKVSLWTHPISTARDVERIWNYTCSKGIRELTDQQISDLAQEISSAYEKLDRPFYSIKELIKHGLLQNAIDRTDINTLVKGMTYEQAIPELRLPKMSNLYLSQSDLIMRLAPLMSVRSDTFTIHAKVIHRPDEFVEIEKNLEMLVQREINQEHLDGRSWKVLSFNWK